jgi:sorbitol-6-phosphate 2-dehydrogenase
MYQHFAALIRGLCIDLTGKPQFAVCEKNGQAIPPEALRIETQDGAFDLAGAARAVRGAYAAWKANHPAAGIALPSCAALAVNGKTEAVYWLDGDLDGARKRLADKNAAPREESAHMLTPAVNAGERAQVVKNRVALVTGGAQGIGEEIVRNLAALGAVVFIADLNLEGAQALAEKINAQEGRTAALAVQANVSDEASVEAAFDRIAELTGGFDLCVSNAGVLKAGSVLEQPLADFNFVTSINYTGFFITSKFAARLLKTQHETAPRWKTDIIQINSKSGLEGSNKNGAYAGGKFGGLGLVASFALELVEYNIKVNAICPGNFLDGPLWSHPEKGLFVQYLNTGKVPGAKTIADVRAFYESKVPMKRGCTGKDLARAIFYLVEQEYETGQAVPVTGGQVMLH